MLKNLTVFAALLAGTPRGCKGAVSSNLCLKITQSNVSCLKKIQDKHKTTTCVFFVLLLSFCTGINDWKKKHLKFSLHT